MRPILKRYPTWCPPVLRDEARASYLVSSGAARWSASICTAVNFPPVPTTHPTDFGGVQAWDDILLGVLRRSEVEREHLHRGQDVEQRERRHEPTLRLGNVEDFVMIKRVLRRLTLRNYPEGTCIRRNNVYGH